MKCTFCQAELAPDEAFCHNCGQKVTSEPEPAAPPAAAKAAPAEPQAPTEASDTPSKVRKPFIKIGIAALAVVVLLAAALILIPRLTGSSGDQLVTSRLLYARGEENFYIIDGKGNKATFEYDSAKSIHFSADRSAAALTVEDGDEFPLYAIRNGTVTLVCENAGQFQISMHGDTIAYFTDADSEDETASLYLYDIRKNESTLIEKNVPYFDSEDMSGTMSPDGRTIAYVSQLDYEKGTVLMKISTDGAAPEQLGRNEVAFAVSNHADYLYLGTFDDLDEGDWTLYVRHNDKETTLLEDQDSSDFGTFWFNADLTQVLLSLDGKTYFSNRGGEPERLFTDSVFDIVAQDNLLDGDYGTVDILGWKSFANRVCLGSKSDGTLYYLGRDFNAERIDKGIFRAYISARNVKLADGSSIVYISEDGELLSANLSGGDPKEIARGDTINALFVSQDGKLIYFVNDYDELYCIKNGKPSSHIADDVDSDACAFDRNTHTFYFVADNDDEDGVLYSSANGGKKEKVSGGSGVYDILSDSCGLLFVKHADLEEKLDDLYQLAGSDKLELLLSDVLAATLYVK